MNGIFRKEIKYVIPLAEYLRLKPWLCRLLTPDANSADGQYRIRSLYYDALDEKDLFDNLDGVREKRKLRLRAYLPELDRAKLECKAKDGSDGIKYDVWVDREEIEQLVAGEYQFLRAKQTPDARRIYQRMVSGAYKPKTVIEYLRTAYTYPVSETRVTFDTEIRATLTGNGFLEEYPPFVPLLPKTHGVLEIKYNQFPPYPVAQLLRHIDCMPQAYSKYTQARTFHL